MKLLLSLSLLLALVLSLSAATRTLTVLGNQKVKTQWDGDMPKAMKAKGIETNVTGILIADGKLIPTYGFDAPAKNKLTYVKVEDVTGKEPILLVDDQAPILEKGHWKGNSRSRNITPEEVPWLFTSGDTLTVYRFTVRMENEAEPVVIYQPSVFRDSSKQRLRMMTDMLKQR